MEKKFKKRGYYSEIVTGTTEHPVKPEVVLSNIAPKRTKLAWQVLTEHHSARISQLNVQTAYQCLGEAKRWMSFDEDRSIAFPAETFTPKVQMELNVEPKRLPRNVEMERRRKLYRSLRIEDALEAIGVASSEITPPSAILSLLPRDEIYGLFSTAHVLPIEFFDDDEYDCRTIEEWLNLGTINGKRSPLPATVFVPRFQEDDRKFDKADHMLENLFSWYNAAVTGYDYHTKLWSVITLDGKKRKYSIPRIYIRFYAEDPRIFAKRMAAAIESRRIAEASIKLSHLLCFNAGATKTN
ncbi:dynein axonemal heavy chain 1-like [Nomia melanderi]|uniref:dynein axonemal heavy chain 1-like n=1 Tax=Nomia melanderi TaxID=2448451 RepID=UPI003FCC6174